MYVCVYMCVSVHVKKETDKERLACVCICVSVRERGGRERERTVCIHMCVFYVCLCLNLCDRDRASIVCVHMYVYVHVCVYDREKKWGGARGVMVIVVGEGTRRHEFKSWTRLIAFHVALISLGKVWIQWLSLQLWVNSRAD